MLETIERTGALNNDVNASTWSFADGRADTLRVIRARGIVIDQDGKSTLDEITNVRAPVGYVLTDTGNIVRSTDFISGKYNH